MDRFTGALFGLLLAIAGSWYVNKTMEPADHRMSGDGPAQVLSGEVVVTR